MFKAHRFLYHSTLGSGVIKKKRTPSLASSLDRDPACIRHCSLAQTPPLEAWIDFLCIAGRCRL